MRHGNLLSSGLYRRFWNLTRSTQITGLADLGQGAITAGRELTSKSHPAPKVPAVYIIDLYDTTAACTWQYL